MTRLEDTALEIRRRVVRMHHDAQVGHVGSSLSATDIIASFYFGYGRVNPEQPLWAKRDRFILSKGHAATALYTALAMRGFFPEALLDTFCQAGSLFAEHPPAHGIPGVEAGTGSLGHGLGIGVGMAMASRIMDTPYRVFALLSDGETQEGSVWEAARLAAEHKLGNLCAIVDWNGLQGIGPSTLCGDLRAKFAAFGWVTYEVDGHNPRALEATLSDVGESGEQQPLAILAHTIKGKGIPRIEGRIVSHYAVPTDADLIAL